MIFLFSAEICRQFWHKIRRKDTFIMQNEQNDRHGSLVLVITGVCGSIFFIYCGYLIAAMIGYVQEYSTDALTGAYVILSKPFDKYFNQFTPITMILGFIIFECIFFLMVIRKRIPQEENGNVLVNPEVIDVAEESFSQNTLENPNRIFDEMLRESDNSGSDMNETGYVSPDFVSKEDLQDPVSKLEESDAESDKVDPEKISFSDEVVTELLNEYDLSQIRAMLALKEHISDCDVSLLRRMFKPTMSAEEISDYINIFYD